LLRQRKADGLVKVVRQPRPQMLARRRQTMNCIIEPYELAGGEFTVAREGLGNAARVVHRLYQHATRLIRLVARSALSSRYKLHAGRDARKRTKKKGYENSHMQRMRRDALQRSSKIYSGRHFARFPVFITCC